MERVIIVLSLYFLHAQVAMRMKMMMDGGKCIINTIVLILGRLLNSGSWDFFQSSDGKNDVQKSCCYIMISVHSIRTYSSSPFLVDRDVWKIR